MDIQLAAIDAQVRALVAERTKLATDESDLPDDTLLTDLGVDSIALLSIVVGVEERFDLEIPDRDVIPDHFDSIAHIVQYVARRRGQ